MGELWAGRPADRRHPKQLTSQVTCGPRGGRATAQDWGAPRRARKPWPPIGDRGESPREGGRQHGRPVYSRTLDPPGGCQGLSSGLRLLPVGGREREVPFVRSEPLPPAPKPVGSSPAPPCARRSVTLRPGQSQARGPEERRVEAQGGRGEKARPASSGQRAQPQPRGRWSRARVGVWSWGCRGSRLRRLSTET